MRILGIATLIMGAASGTGFAADKSVDYAYALCRVIDGTGLTAAPCDVSGWNQSITTVIDMTSGEARKLCAQMSAYIKKEGIQFREGWTLQIKSPYSGDNSIAYCNVW